MADKTFVLKDLGMEAIKDTFKKLSQAHVVVGYPGEGPVHEGSDMSVAAIAVVTEYGSPANNVPARPFMRQTWGRNRAETKLKAQLAFGMAVRQKWSVRDSLQRLGLFYEDKVRDTIDNGSFEALAQTTIDRKGSSKPLIDTGDLRRRVATKVVGA